MGSFQDKYNPDIFDNINERQEENFLKNVAINNGLEFVNLLQNVEPSALKLIGETEAKEARIAAYDINRNTLKVAVSSLDNPKAKVIINKLEDRGYKVIKTIASNKTIEYMWRIYKDISSAQVSQIGNIDISSAKIHSFVDSVNSTNELRAAMEVLSNEGKTNATEILELLLGGAIALGSSDIHLEPENSELIVRYRLDGILASILTIPKEDEKLIISRIKLVSGLKLNIVSQAQDGRMSVQLDKRKIEIRISTIPGQDGESIVMRLLDPKGLTHSLDKLGFDKKALEIVNEQIRRPNGIIINSGPTGSGKTTSLYSFLKQIVTPNIKIITIEDPIEYELPGIVQTQVKKGEYSFASGLRSILRQDPDVIMLGEIRDEEVAQTAINAALSGHLVFSTLHTNNAPGGFTRLLDLGIEEKVMSSAINLIIAQRLVRKIVPEKSKTVKVDGKDLEAIKKNVDAMPEYYKNLIANKPIDEFLEPDENKVSDSHEAYKGRIGVFEVIIMDKSVEKAMASNSTSIRSIYEATRDQGLLTLSQDAILKAIQGATSLSEIKRVVDIYSVDR